MAPSSDSDAFEAVEDMVVDDKVDDIARTAMQGPRDEQHADKSAFVRDVATASRSIAPVFPQQYKNVYVLLICWEHDNLGTELEMKELDHVFRNLYHYETARYFIPSVRCAQKKLRSAINAFVHGHDDPSNLLVIYYGGHSQKNRDTIWSE